jgi:heptosyltransferase II
VAARASSAALFRMLPGVDDVVAFGGTGGGLRALLGSDDARTLAGVGAGIALLLPNSFRSAWTARQAGIAERWGFDRDMRGRLLTRRVAKPRGAIHQAEYYDALVTALGMTVTPDPVRLAPPDDARARAVGLVGEVSKDGSVPLVGMAPGAAYGRAKQWPPERYAQVARLLHERTGAVSVIVGASGDRAAGAEIVTSCAAANASGSVLDLTGRTDLPTLVALMERCRAFVSNDSGAMHLAAAAGLPVTAIFGSTDERGTSPLPAAATGVAPHAILSSPVWCRPCMLRECPIDHRCMTGVEAGRVADAVVGQVTFTC